MEGNDFFLHRECLEIYPLHSISMIVTEAASSWLSVSRHLKIACSLGRGGVIAQKNWKNGFGVESMIGVSHS